MSQHLSLKEIDRWLIGERPAEVASHLQSCAACAGEVERIAGPLTLFGGAVRSWGREQMRPMPVSGVAAAAPIVWWRMALAVAALFLVIAVPVFRHRQATREAAAQDDLLLRRVQQEISLSVPAPMEPLAKLMPNDLSR